MHKDSSREGDGVFVAQLTGVDYRVGQDILVESIEKIVCIYCGHPSVIDSCHERWTCSHGECHEPDAPDPKSTDLLAELFEVCDTLKKELERLCNTTWTTIVIMNQTRNKQVSKIKLSLFLLIN